MSLSLKPQHLKRYSDILLLLAKHGKTDWIRRAQLEEILHEDVEQEGSEPADAERLTADLEKMGPTFIKLGQLLSTRADILPETYRESLSRLQDHVDPFPFEEVQQIVTTELGIRLSKAFSYFDPVPLAAASLGQVHRATLHSGREVAVKVQRPGVRKQIADDLDALAGLAQWLNDHTEIGRKYNFIELLEEFRKTLLRELDYRQEAQNMVLLHNNLAEFNKLRIPLPVDDYTTSLVLTMEYIPGKKITSIGPLAKMEMSGKELVDQLFGSYLHQVLVDGFFHADPHPGNVFLTDDGMLALIDIGMVARISNRMQDHLIQLLLSIAEHKESQAAEIIARMGMPHEDFQRETFLRKIADAIAIQENSSLESLNIGRTLMNISRVSALANIKVPPELMMLGKALMNLDVIARVLDPSFNPNAAIRENSLQIMNSKARGSLSSASFFNLFIETKDFLERLPGRLNQLLDTVTQNQLRVKVDTIDETRLIHGLQKIANRITIGLLLSALIIGAAMLMRVETSFHILGYPGMAMIFFLIAAAGAITLVLRITLHDR